MNSANPFQIPTCLQRVDERRRRERFKKGVVATIVAIVLLLVGLLIQGCKSERASTTIPQQFGAIPSGSQTALAPEQKPNLISPVPQSNPITVSKVSMTPVISHSATVYVVKSGDTLTRIAKTHGISVKSLKSVNELASDRIVVGAKLKIPEA